MAYTALAYSYWASLLDAHADAYATPTNDTDYSCHIKAIELIFIQPIIWGLYQATSRH